MHHSDMGVEIEGGCAQVGTGELWENFGPYLQFCCESKTGLKK